MFTMLAIATMIAPTPPATASQQSCDYSVRLNDDTYKCYTTDEYNTMIQEKSEKHKKEASAITGFLLQYWWAILGVILIAFVISAVKGSDDIKFIG